MSRQSIFDGGIAIQLMDMLNAREHRAQLQAALIEKHPNDVVVSLKLNMPGEIKTSSAIVNLFEAGYEQFKQISQIEPIFELDKTDLVTGPEVYLVLSGDIKTIKQLAIKFENQSSLGRLFDADVLDAQHVNQALSRKDFGIAPRRCYVCGDEAKICARSQKHSVTELQNEVNELYDNYQATI